MPIALTMGLNIAVIDLVKHHQAGDLGGINFLQYLLHLFDVLKPLWIVDIYHMQQQGSLIDLFEGRVERLDQIVWKIAYKPHCVRQYDFPALW